MNSKNGSDQISDAPHSAASSQFQYPFAAAPDIIRSNQKDTYLQGVLLERLSTILRQTYGARFVHNHTSEAKTFADLLYLGLTTFVGNRTLGEEYCDIVQIEDDTLRLPSIQRRAGYILTSIVLPYSLTRILPAIRRRARQKLELNLQRLSQSQKAKDSSGSYRIQSYLLANLDTITSPSPLYAISLATFYFSGAYYHLGKRLWGLRYIFTRRIAPSEQRVGYEVLGVLLVLQMAVQGWLHMHHTISNGPPAVANAGSAAGGTAVLDGGVEIALDRPGNALLFESPGPTTQISSQGIEKMTHTPALSHPRYDLRDEETMQWISGKQLRKCTLCLEEMKDPSATTCGHMFCWTCIGDWCREKPECPLCRQISLPQHILPLRS
ncbi:MAG: peroxisome biogenesis factor 10 [Candelina submexicana]|nr:MAG: peroxisome biogenesis factor 10 [Candelina submexicana]